jgi:hypothetical protein
MLHVFKAKKYIGALGKIFHDLMSLVGRSVLFNAPKNCYFSMAGLK